MIGDPAGDEDLVARPQGGGRHVRAVVHEADPRRADVHLVAHAARHDLRVAGDDVHAGLGGGGRDRRDLMLELVRGQALLEDEGERQRERLGTGHGDVVERAVDREVPDRAAGKDDAYGGHRV